jgi:hypothetical protein
MSCADLRAKVQALQKASDNFASELKQLKIDGAWTETDQGAIVTSPPFPQVRQMITEWQQTAAELKAAKQALDACLLAPLPDRPAGAAPAHILHINYSNPAPPMDVSRPDWTSSFIGTSTSFPQGAEMEWKPVINPDSEYDDSPVGASGWVIHPNFSGADIPFTHPFGPDWEFGFSVDSPNPNPLQQAGAELRDDLHRRMGKAAAPSPHIAGPSSPPRGTAEASAAQQTAARMPGPGGRLYPGRRLRLLRCLVN